MTYLDTQSSFQQQAENFLKSKGFNQGLLLKNSWEKDRFEFKLFSKSFQLLFVNKVVTQLTTDVDMNKFIRVYETKVSKTKKDNHTGVIEPVFGNFRATFFDGFVNVYNHHDEKIERIEVVSLNETTKSKIRSVLKIYGLRVMFHSKKKQTHIVSVKGLLKMPVRS